MIAKWDARHLRRAAVSLDRATGRWTVGHVLRELGLDAAWVERYSSAAGRAAAKAHRATTGREPLTALTLRKGKVREVKGYASLLELLPALLTYPRLRVELGV